MKRNSWESTGRSRGTRWLTLLLLATLVGAAGCSRDLGARKQKYLQSGNRYFNNGRFQEAVIEYKNSIQIDPRFAEGYYRLGLALIQEQQWQSAAQSLGRAIELAPDNLDARLQLSNILVAAAQYADAKTQAKEVLERDPKRASAHLVIGQVYLQQKHYVEAKEEFEQAAQLVPQDPVPYGNLGLTELLSGKFDAAEKNFRKALELKPDEPQSFVNLANFYRSQREPARAEEVLREGMTRNAEAISLPLAIADLYMYEDRVSESKALLDQIEANEHKFPDGRRQVADFYFMHNSPDSALDRYLTLIKKKSRDLAVAKRAAECYLLLGRLQEAEDWIGKHDENSKDLESRLLRARVYLAEYRTRDATNELQALTQENPTLAAPHYYLAQAFAQKDDWKSARQALIEAVRVQPGYLPALLGLGDLSVHQNDTAVALEYANQIISQSYWVVNAHLIAGNAYVLRGDLAQAAKEFEVAVALNPRSAAAQERLARLLEAQGKSREAEKAYEDSLAADPSYGMALGGLADKLAREGHADQARTRIERQLVKQPRAYELQLVRGDFCMNRSDWNCAEEAYHQALTVNPFSVNAYLALARLYAQTNRANQAVQQYEFTRRRFPNYLPSYVQLGLLHEKLGDFDRAREVYQDALRVDPNFAPAENDLAWLYCEKGGPLNEALELAQRAKAQQPDDPHISDTLAWIYYKEGLYSSAVKLLELAVTQDPQSPEFQFHLGMTYLAQGKRKLSRESLQAALRLGLDRDNAKVARDALAKS